MFAKFMRRNSTSIRIGLFCIVAVPVVKLSGLPKIDYKFTVKTYCEESKHSTAASTVAPLSVQEKPAVVVPVKENTTSVNALDGSAATLNEKLVAEDEEEEAKWKAKSESCGFCKFFLDSPCNAVFKAWSTCVDKAKAEGADFAEVCAPCTRALTTCTSENTEYFQMMEQQQEDDDDEEEGEEGDSEVGVATNSSNDVNK